jgi:purine-binding chemotaxis protein CheW
VIDLRRYYGYKDSTSDKNRVLVVNIDDEKIGLIVDNIIEISDYDKSDIDIMPANFEDQKISGIIHEKDELISIVGEDILKELMKLHNSFESDKSNLSQNDIDIKNVLETVIFKLYDEEYAMDIKYIKEIIDLVDVTKIADAPELINGVINIRGQVVTIGSLYKRLELEESKNKNSKILVTHVNDDLVGFCVDSISDIIDIKENEISTNNEKEDLFSNVLHLNSGERLVLLIDPEKIFKKEIDA